MRERAERGRPAAEKSRHHHITTEVSTVIIASSSLLLLLLLLSLLVVGVVVGCLKSRKSFLLHLGTANSDVSSFHFLDAMPAPQRPAPLPALYAALHAAQCRACAVNAAGLTLLLTTPCSSSLLFLLFGAVHLVLPKP